MADRNRKSDTAKAQGTEQNIVLALITALHCAGLLLTVAQLLSNNSVFAISCSGYYTIDRLQMSCKKA